MQNFEIQYAAYFGRIAYIYGLSVSEWAVLDAILKHWNNGKDAFPSQEYIANGVGLKRLAVMKNIKKLEDKNIITKRKTKYSNHYNFSDEFLYLIKQIIESDYKLYETIDVVEYSNYYDFTKYVLNTSQSMFKIHDKVCETYTNNITNKINNNIILSNVDSVNSINKKKKFKNQHPIRKNPKKDILDLYKKGLNNE